MQDNLLEILNELEDQTEKFISGFESKMNPISEDLFLDVQSFLAELKKNKVGNIAASVENLNKIDRFKVTLNRIIENGDYGQEVNSYISDFKKNTVIVDDFFSEMVTTFESNSELKGLLYNETRSTTLDTLLNSGIDANFTDPIIKILKDNTVNGVSIKDATKSVKEFMIGTGDTKLLRYSRQVASDALTQYNANYFELISNDLGLKHYYYKGTKIKSTRDFCEHISGKYFTEAELKSYVESKKPWSGMIKGTTWATFPRYRGGYNCRHYAIPVSKELYDNYKKR